ncbi:MAG: phosphate signaling complex PhoU family protein [Cetobacterium sp.]
MRNLEESLTAIDNHYLEMMKYVNRVFDVNLEILKESKFNPVLYGECKIMEDSINAFEVVIKEDAIITMARFQPAAGNLRKLVMLINSARVVERMGDLLKAVLGLTREIEKKGAHLSSCLKDNIFPLLLKIKRIFDSYMKAFLDSDEKVLYLLLTLDEEIDEIVRANSQIFIEFMKVSPDNVEAGTILELINKKLERLSDHIIHLATDLIYILNGQNLRKTELLEK